MKFRGKTGYALWAVLIWCIVLGAAYAVLIGIDDTANFIIAEAVLLAAAGLALWFILRNYIMLTEETLNVFFGPSSTEIPVKGIISVQKKKSVIASSAGSTRRIELVYNKNGGTDVIQISTKNEDDFIRQLLLYNDNIKEIK